MKFGEGVCALGAGMEGGLKVKHKYAREHTNTRTHWIGSVSVEHQSLLDMVAGHTSKRFTL